MVKIISFSDISASNSLSTCKNSFFISFTNTESKYILPYSSSVIVKTAHQQKRKKDDSPDNSEKRRKLHSYTLEFKLDAIAFVKAGNNKEAAARMFCVDGKRIRDWYKQDDRLKVLATSGKDSKRKRLDGEGAIICRNRLKLLCTTGLTRRDPNVRELLERWLRNTLYLPMWIKVVMINLLPVKYG